MSRNWRITVRRNGSDHNWPWTAWLERWDGTEWRGEDAEDGDTREEAVAELQATNPRARGQHVF
jgi:hypothetical protein